MDIVTQALLGGSLSQSLSNSEHVRKASLIGLFSGMLADADILIRSANDPLLALEYHRHFTHSIFFIPFGALIAFLLLWPFFRKHLSATQIYLYSLAGYCLSGLLDACTSYGTHIFWPVSDSRISWHIISIVDPVFSGCLLVMLVIGYRKRQPLFARAGLVLAMSYLIFAVVQMQRAELHVKKIAEQRGHSIESILVKPTFANTILWRSIYKSADRFYIDAIHTGWEIKSYEGTSIKKLNPATILADININSVLAGDIQRFEQFSDGYLIQHPEKPDVIGDIRFSMNPLGSIPLWGIQFNRDEPQQHVHYKFYRQTSAESGQRFINMLKGKEPGTENR